MSSKSLERKCAPKRKVAGSGVKIPFLDLSDDEIVRVLSLLWYQDLFRMISLSRRLFGLVKDNNTLVKSLLVSQVDRCNWKNFKADQFCRGMTNTEILTLASRLSLWPTEIDTADLRYNLAEAFVEGQTSKCVMYSGAVLGNNRSFVANHHFPLFGGSKQEGGLETMADFPFTKPVFDATLQSTIPVLSGISYFEITIHKALRQPDAVAEEGPCVAIGIANHRHRLNNMPGWDSNSYGFHGDDGCFFRRDADEGVSISEEAQFGEGDTVGLGVIYCQLKDHLNETGRMTPNELLLTVNGKYICRYLFSASAFGRCTWFPCVGTDCHCPIEMNFGNKGVPFAFDVVQFERDKLTPPPTTAPKRKQKKKGKGKKKAEELSPLLVTGVATKPSLLFTDPHHAENKLVGGLYRDEAFRSRVTEHIMGNNACDYESTSDMDSVIGFDSDGSIGVEEGSDEEGDDEGEKGEDGDEIGEDGSGSEFEEPGEGNESSDADSIASESTSSLPAP